MKKRLFQSSFYPWLGPSGLAFIALVLLLLFSPLFVPDDPYAVDMGARFQPISSAHWLGTDELGRDVASRLLIGGRNTMLTSLSVLALALLIGTAVGLLSGYIGGIVDRIFIRVADSFLAFPDFLIAIVLSGLLRPSLLNLWIAIVSVKWISYARIVRNLVRQDKYQDYIAIARLNGMKAPRIMSKHLMPHALRQIAVLAALDIGKIVLMIAALSYLGLGMQPPQPEWGAMLNQGRAYMTQSLALMIGPGVSIMLMVALASLTGERLRRRIGR